MFKLQRVFNAAAHDATSADADRLIEALGNGAYEEACTRAREQRLGKVIETNRPNGHWDRVRKEIARRTGRKTNVDSATRYLKS